MEESLKFNSQVCTTKEQSQRLLALGLKPETADMEIEIFKGDNSISGYVSKGYWDTEISKELVELIPAWSLHRLLCMLDYDNADTFNIMPNLAYEDVIATISLRINCGAFNKEYLKQ